MHHAVVYEIPTAAAPEKAIAERSRLRVSGGLYRKRVQCEQARRPQRHRGHAQVSINIVRPPVFDDEGEQEQDRNRQ